jgi:AraC family transcriptional regulator
VDLNPAFPKAVVSSSADTLVATHCVQPAGRLIERKTERLAVLVPGEGCSFHATYRSSSHRSHTAAVREPFIALIPAGQVHVLHFRRACDLTILEIRSSLVDEKARDAGGVAAWDAFPRHGILDSFLRAVGDTVKAVLHSTAPPCDADLHAIADVMASHLAVICARRRRACGGNAALLSELSARAKDFVRAHLDDRLPVERLAAHVGLSPFHFARSFRAATGQSPHAFITAERLARACVLLRETNVPLVQVAMNVGFQTQGHFTVLFHRAIGQTPRAYRLGHAHLKP